MSPKDDISAEVTLAEGAAWLVRLQDPNRTPETDAAFREWVQDPAHARAFGRATEIWEIIPGAVQLGEEMALSPPAKPRPAARRYAPLLAACVAIALLVAGLATWFSRDTVYVTKVGQQQTVNLSDGSRLALNTDSRAVVSFSAGERHVRLDRGEAMFEVAKDADRPFLVQAGDETVRALGTTFTVRREPQAFAVVLVEGKVKVLRRSLREPKGETVAVLAPGERLTMRGGAPAAIDRPKLETVTAWRRGEAMFDDTTLAAAAAELNRYGGTRVEIRDPSVAVLRASGVFQTNDPEEFAKAIAGLHGLQVERTDGALILER